jgi:hypothetical protein
MDGYPRLYSEEDTRTQVVSGWLVDHDFGPSDIFVEYSCVIRLGRKILSKDSEDHKKNSPQTFKPRADIPVRRYDGKNLLIVEVNPPDEPLDDNVKEQRIRYARLLHRGGIPPFVTLTSSHETKIYDSTTGELINGTTILVYYPHAKGGFRVSTDGFASRVEALATCISLQEFLSEHFKRIYQASILTNLRIFLCEGDEEHYGLA